MNETSNDRCAYCGVSLPAGIDKPAHFQVHAEHRAFAKYRAAVSLLETLERIRDYGPMEVFKGICWHINSEEAKNVFDELAKKWPKYSGVKGYPVPGEPGDEPGYAYMTSANKWNRRSTYGKLRWELVAFLIEELKQIVTKETPS